MATAILGVSGRLGRAIVRQAGADALRGLARRRGADADALDAFVAADRRDVDALRRLIDGADAVIDLAGMDGPDADALAAALAACAQRPRRVVLASSLAEQAPAAWTSHPASWAALEGEPAPTEPYGAGKRALRRALGAALAGLGVALDAVLLPQLHALDELDGREARYLRAARAGDAIALPSGGSTRPCVVAIETAAGALLALATAPMTGAQGADARVWQLAPALRPTLGELVAALLAGAATDAQIVDGDGRPLGHAGGDEVVDGAPLRAHLPALPWPDLVERHRRHGAAIAAALDAAIDAAAPER